MHIQKTPPATIRRASVRAAKAIAACRRFVPAVILGGALVLLPAAKAGLISSVTEGPANAPYSYRLTIEFANSDYYNFVLRSPQATLTGETLLNTVASLTPGMSVQQTTYSFGDAVNGITIGSDTNSGFTNNSYWAYWNGNTATPVQWTSANNGESATTLTPGQADGWVYSGGSNPPQATFAAPVPEPGAWVLVSLPLAGWILSRVRRGLTPARA